jgi:hypothetical protein
MTDFPLHHSGVGERRAVGLAVLFGALLLAAAAVLGLTAGVGAVWSAVTSGSGTATGRAASGPAAPASSHGLTVPISIRMVSTPDGQEPAYVGPGGVGARSLFTAKAGEPVTLVVDNDSGMPHTFTVSALGLNASVGPSAEGLRITFTPHRPGSYFWQCLVPCGPWTMSHVGYMEGYFTVAA